MLYSNAARCVCDPGFLPGEGLSCEADPFTVVDPTVDAATLPGSDAGSAADRALSDRAGTSDAGPPDAAGAGDSSKDAGPELCEPTTCEQQQVSCGVISNGCGDTIDCGTCDPLGSCAAIGPGAGGEVSWYGVGGSDYGPWQVQTSWGAASGGGISDSGRWSDLPRLAVTQEGELLVAWNEATATVRQVYLKRFDGASWGELGAGSASGSGASGTSGNSDRPAMALDLDGRPILAWRDTSASSWQIYAKRYDGQRWVEIGAGSASGHGVSQAAGASDAPALAVDAEGRVLLAWHCNGSGNQEIYLKRFDGLSWSQISSSASGGGVSRTAGRSAYPSVAAGADGTVAVAWSDDSSGNGEIYLRALSGGFWSEVGEGSASGGGVSSTTGDSTQAALTVSSTGEPMVAWSEISAAGKQIYLKRYAAGAWGEVGGGSASGGGVSKSPGAAAMPSLALDGSDLPILAWTDSSPGNQEVYIARFDGVAWQDLGRSSAHGGGVSGTEGPSTQPALGLAPDGTPAVAWVDSSIGEQEIYVRRLEAGTWEEPGGAVAVAGGVSRTGARSDTPSLAMDTAGDLAVAWRDQSSGRPQIYVRRLCGDAWRELGGISAHGGGVSQSLTWAAEPILVAEADGHLVVAWSDFAAGDQEIYLKRFDGQHWLELGASASGGGVSSTAGVSSDPAIAVTGAGEVLVAWTDDSSGVSQVLARRFDSGAWGDLGAGSAQPQGVSRSGVRALQPALSLDDGEQPVLAWRDDSAGQPAVYVRRLEGDDWGELGAGSASGAGVSQSSGAAVSPSLGKDDRGRMVVAWADNRSGRWEIHARIFDGAGWVELGGSSTAGGISRTAGNATSPSVVTDPAGQLTVTWQDDSSGQAEIYVRRFDGAAWQEPVAGSATLGGVSNSRAASTAPTLGWGNGLVCVAWSEYGGTSTDIVARCAGAP